jgi:hypothetical protein
MPRKRSTRKSARKSPRKSPRRSPRKSARRSPRRTCNSNSLEGLLCKYKKEAVKEAVKKGGARPNEIRLGGVNSVARPVADKEINPFLDAYNDKPKFVDRQPSQNSVPKNLQAPPPLEPSAPSRLTRAATALASTSANLLSSGYNALKSSANYVLGSSSENPFDDVEEMADEQSSAPAQAAPVSTLKKSTIENLVLRNAMTEDPATDLIQPLENINGKPVYVSDDVWKKLLAQKTAQGGRCQCFNIQNKGQPLKQCGNTNPDTNNPFCYKHNTTCTNARYTQ